MWYSLRMNRRTFFVNLAVLPFVGSLIKAFDINSKPELHGQMKYGHYPGISDPYMILSPYEIIDAGFKWVDKPCFIENGRAYCVKNTRLNLWARSSQLKTSENKQLAISQLRTLGITHIYMVAFEPYFLPSYWTDTRSVVVEHRAFVRGVKVVSPC